jgi:ribosomal protein S4
MRSGRQPRREVMWPRARHTGPKAESPADNTKPASQTKAKDSDYSLQLKEKQKLRQSYGILEEKFRDHDDKAVQKVFLLSVILHALSEILYQHR